MICDCAEFAQLIGRQFCLRRFAVGCVGLDGVLHRQLALFGFGYGCAGMDERKRFGSPCGCFGFGLESLGEGLITGIDSCFVPDAPTLERDLSNAVVGLAALHRGHLCFLCWVGLWPLWDFGGFLSILDGIW